MTDSRSNTSNEDVGSPYKWPFKWVNGVITPINGLKTNGFLCFSCTPINGVMGPYLRLVFGPTLNEVKSVFFEIHGEQKVPPGFFTTQPKKPGHNENESLCMGPKKSNIKQRKMNQTSTTKHQTWNHGWLLAKGFHFIMQVHIIIFHANLYNFHHNFLSHSPLLFSGLSVACATWRSISPKKLTPSEIFFKSFWDNQISFGDSDVLFWCRNWQSCEYIDTSAIVYRLTFCKDENFKVFKVQKPTTHSYCWWKKSCTSW